MAAGVFERAEHEFLRIAAMVEPGWEKLRQLGQDDFDWQYLRETALLHQLDGVIAWRLLDTELNGVVPNTVRDGCRQYSDHLDQQGDLWRDDWGKLRDALENADIEYVQWGGIIPYAEYPLPMWPRVISDIDIAVPGKQLASMREVLEIFGSIHFPSIEVDATVVLPGGTPVYCRCDSLDGEWACRSEAWVFENASDFTYLDIQTRVPSPSALLLQQALDTWSSVHNDAGPLPLHALSRQSNLANRVKELAAVLDLASDEEDRRLASVRAENPRETELDQLWLESEVSAFNKATWLMEIADEVYGLPDEIMVPMRQFEFDETIPFYAFGDRTFERCAWYRWKHWPGTESFMFEHRGTCNPEHYVNAGLWESVPGAAPRSEN